MEASSMHLGRFIPNILKDLIVAPQINVVSNVLLRFRRLPSMLGPLAEGGREILYGTALFPGIGFHVADVGAYRGWYTVLSSKMVGPQGGIYSFEPANFQTLRNVVLLNRLKNVTLFRLALSDVDGFETLYLSECPSMHSTVLRRSARVLKVECMQLDTLVRLKRIPKLDLIKCDVEGAEVKVLRGCKHTIEKFEPIFSIDVNHWEEELEDVEAFLKEFDYMIRTLFGEKSKPYSVVAYPSYKEAVVEQSVAKTRELSSVVFRSGRSHVR